MNDGAKIKAERERRRWSQTKLAEEASSFGPSVSQQAIDRIEKGSESKHKLAVLRALKLIEYEEKKTKDENWVGVLDEVRDLPNSMANAVLSHVPVAPRKPDLARKLAESNVSLSEHSISEHIGGLRDVPELGIAVGGEDGDFTLNGTAVNYVRRPPSLLHRKVFAVRVKNDSMEPRYYEGDLLFVEEKREPRPGDDTVIEFKIGENGEPGRALIKRLVSKSLTSLVAEQFNPPKLLTIDRANVKWIYRVIPNNELFGV